MTELIDSWLTTLGTAKLIDGDKVRDMLLDLRLTAAETEKEVAWLQHLTATPVN